MIGALLLRYLLALYFPATCKPSLCVHHHKQDGFWFQLQLHERMVQSHPLHEHLHQVRWVLVRWWSNWDGVSFFICGIQMGWGGIEFLHAMVLLHPHHCRQPCVVCRQRHSEWSCLHIPAFHTACVSWCKWGSECCHHHQGPQRYLWIWSCLGLGLWMEEQVDCTHQRPALTCWRLVWLWGQISVECFLLLPGLQQWLSSLELFCRLMNHSHVWWGHLEVSYWCLQGYCLVQQHQNCSETYLLG